MKKLFTKYNKELLYSMIFFVAAILWFFLNPVGEIADFVDSSPNSLNIKYQLLNLGVLPIFYHTWSISIIGLFFLLLCSIYVGILSIRKAPVDGVGKLFGFVPRSISGYLAVLLIFISSFYLVVNLLIVLNLLG